MFWCSPKNMLLLYFFFLFGQVLSQDPGCDFYQMVTAGARYEVFSPNYPNSYNRPSTCRWQFECPLGSRCQLDCLLEMPQTSGCITDRFLISRTGDPQLNNAEYYCGRGNLNGVLSVNQKINIGLIISSSSAGGRFMCNLTTQASAPPPPPTCNCGMRKQNRIVGGTNAGPNEFPMMAALILRNSSPAQVTCGAVIISNIYVMTAAHCLDNLTPGSLQIIVGSSNKDQGQRYNVQSFTKHPSYNSNTYDYDIAVIRVQGSIAFNDNVGPVCLPYKFQNVDLTGSNLTLLGWGTIFFGGPTSANLQKVDVRVISQQECMQSAAASNRQICTKTLGKDACQNDSGGPGLLTDPRTGRLFSIGIVSYGDACGGSSPGINTRVTQLLDWVVRAAPGEYCSIQ